MSLLTTTDGVCTTDSLTGRSAYGAAFLVGVIAHLLFFRVGEWDLYVVPLFFGFTLADVAGAAALTHLCPNVVATESFKVVSALVVLSIVGIFASITVYRAGFHRLNRFPGPFMARVTNFYITMRSIKKFRLFEEVQDMHKQYGDIVRIGTLCF